MLIEAVKPFPFRECPEGLRTLRTKLSLLDNLILKRKRPLGFQESSAIQNKSRLYTLLFKNKVFIKTSRLRNTSQYQIKLDQTLYAKMRQIDPHQTSSIIDTSARSACSRSSTSSSWSTSSSVSSSSSSSTSSSTSSSSISAGLSSTSMS